MVERILWSFIGILSTILIIACGKQSGRKRSVKEIARDIISVIVLWVLVISLIILCNKK